MLKAAATSLFSEHDAPTHCSRKDVVDGLASIDQLIAAVRSQVMVYQRQVSAIEAELEGDDPNDGITEHMYQTFGAIERAAANVAVDIRDLQKAMKQLDGYMATAKKDLVAKGIVDAPTVEMEVGSAAVGSKPSNPDTPA